jgi:hypothetical protein
MLCRCIVLDVCQIIDWFPYSDLSFFPYSGADFAMGHLIALMTTSVMSNS